MDLDIFEYFDNNESKDIFKNVKINDQDFEIIIWEQASSNRSQLILSTIQTRSSSNSTLGNEWTERKVVDISRIFSTVEATGYGNLPVGQVKVSRLQVDEHSRINRKEKKKKLSETTVRQIVTKISAWKKLYAESFLYFKILRLSFFLIQIISILSLE